MKYLRKSAAAVFGAAVIAGPALAGDEIRTIELFSRPQASQPAEFQSIQLIAQEWEKLGLDVEVKVMPWEQLSDIVWYQRDKWDATAWQMVGRPERSDPDEIVYNLFHSTTAEKGYNFIGYQNAAFDKVAEEQRITTDQDSRKNLLFEAQKILVDDQPNMMLVHPKNAFAFDKTKFDESTVVEQSGIGIRNAWTFINAQPIGENKDFILNSGDNVIAINPLYISGGVDSWIFELVYDRLMRVGPDGLPQPWAAESYDWKDGTTLEVTLRDGMEWHDGKPVTVEDVKFSFEVPMSG
ncbi:MAG TPA: twin-arginine translocation pathway signal protein, partial [Sulfitobacter sp.]|nr:twin-arginine translocation pathway signal protein [Sulfitobacter sp.]